MLVGGRAVRLASIALFVAVPLSGQEPPPDPEADPEILVIARKLRKVRLNYTTRGSWVPKCEAEVSSGEPRIDRIMCAILRACVREGHREVAPAKACMAKRIDQLADGAAPPTDVAAAPPPPVPQPPQTGPDIVVEGAPDIVVTATSPACAADYGCSGGPLRSRSMAAMRSGRSALRNACRTARSR